MFKCKSCGGDLVLNIAGQELKCPFCDSVFPVSDFEDANEIKEQEVFETTIYTCTQCGAEIMTTDNTAVTFCSYCGTEANLQGRLSQEKRPKFIIPFKQTKEQCKKIYSEHAKKEPYAPKEFSDPEFLENFRGIYIPYWEMSVGFDNNPELKVKETYTSGNYDYTDEYTANPQLKGTQIPIPQDASASFDDEISAQIAPFNKEDMVDFNPAYLAGFFADTADVDADVYTEKAMAMAQDHVIKDVASQFRPGANVMVPSDMASRNEIFGSKIEGSHLNLFPVWFLTWRQGDRLAYGVVNGETGKLAADVPVDVKKFLKVSAIIAVILFAVSTITSVLVLPATVLMISAIAAAIVHILYKQELVSIVERETHANDLGALSGEDLDKAKDDIKKTGVKKKGKVGTIVAVFAVAVIVFLMFSIENAASRASFTCFAISVMGVILFVTSLKYIGRIQGGSMKLMSLLMLAAEIAAFFIAVSKPVSDWIYYGGSIVSLVAVTVVSLAMINQYNRLTTRPLPEFHNREGGNKDVGA